MKIFIIRFFLEVYGDWERLLEILEFGFMIFYIKIDFYFKNVCFIVLSFGDGKFRS